MARLTLAVRLMVRLFIVCVRVHSFLAFLISAIIVSVGGVVVEFGLFTGEMICMCNQLKYYSMYNKTPHGFISHQLKVADKESLLLHGHTLHSATCSQHTSSSTLVYLSCQCSSYSFAVTLLT